MIRRQVGYVLEMGFGQVELVLTYPGIAQHGFVVLSTTSNAKT